MKVRDDILTKVNINKFTLRALNIPCNKLGLVEKIRPAVHDIELIVTEILSQDALPHAIRINDAAELAGINVKEMRKAVHDAIEIGCSEYDGSWNRPTEITVDHLIYLVLCLVISEIGRISDDINEFVVRYYIGRYVDESIVGNSTDMNCYIFLIEYFEYCLYTEKVQPITKYYRENSYGRKMSSEKLINFLKKNYWYGDAAMINSMFRIDIAEPTVVQILTALFGRLTLIKIGTEEEAEEYELNKAFDG
jgi:hypothetical protein